MIHVKSILAASLFCVSFVLATGAAAPVYVVVGPKAPAIERLAADELAGQFGRLFDDVGVKIVNDAPKTTKHVVLIGSPEANPAVKAALGDKWPRVSDQGLVIQSFSRDGGAGLVIGGGSPVATLWAVYEFGRRQGVRYLLREDIYPAEKRPLKLEGFALKIEPVLRSRMWRTTIASANGPGSWGLKDHQRLLRQLAKMKYNRLMLSVFPCEPFVHYEFGGVKKQTALLWYGERYRVDGETAGKKAFGGAKFFENPDFAGKSGYEAMHEAGVAHVRGIIQEGQRLGMKVGLSISSLEFPREFQKALPGSVADRGFKERTIRPGEFQPPNDAILKKLAATKIRAYLKTYPNVDELELWLQEFPKWYRHAPMAWKQLSADGGLKDLTLERLLDPASDLDKLDKRLIKGNLATLAFVQNLFQDDGLLKRPDGKKVELALGGVDPVMHPVLGRVVPAGAATLSSVDFTVRRVLENPRSPLEVPAKNVRSPVIMALTDHSECLLPQSEITRFGKLAGELRKHGWDGFWTLCEAHTELDPTVYFLGRAGWDAKVTPRSAHDELWLGITGNQAATKRLWIAWQHLEKATELTDKNDLFFTFPKKGLMMKHYRPEPIPKWWKQANEHYTQYMIELYRAHGAIDPRARRLLFYYAKRGEYVLEYLAAVKATREAALAKKAGDTEKAIEHLEKAVESTYNCINTLADVARDQSDRGLIAVLNEHAYRPLLAEYEKLLDSE